MDPLALGGQAQLGGYDANTLLDKAHSARDSADLGEAEGAARKFEALFATTLVKELRKALPEGFFGKGAGADVFEGWLDEHVGQALADSGALDLAGLIKTGIGTKLAALEAEAATEQASEPTPAVAHVQRPAHDQRPAHKQETR